MSGWAVEFFIPFKNERVFGKDCWDKDGSEYHRWLNEYLGPIDYSISAGQWRWSTKGTVAKRNEKQAMEYGDRVCFRDARDAMLFKLTWL